MNAIRAGSVVQTGVYVCNEWRGMWTGTVLSVSDDGSLAIVDRGSMFGCRPIIETHQTSYLRLLEKDQ
jgi:hypothetical protein